MLSFQGVTVRYRDDDPPAIDDIDLEVASGERVALVGPSGAGKSTLIALANGLVLPTEGTVEVFGVDTKLLARRAHRETRRRIGTVHQGFALVGPLRVAHNVAAGRLGSWGTLRAIRTLVRPRDSGEIAAALDEVGIENKLWERTDQLSGGQQQRVAIARTLHQGADLLLADEPVSSLDPVNSKAVLDTLRDASGSRNGSDARTLVVSLHDAPLALSHCDRIVGIRGGRVQFDAPPGTVSQEDLVELYAFEHIDP